jgi:hypothetical protein
MRWLSLMGVSLFLAASVQAASIRAYLIRASNDTNKVTDVRLKEIETPLKARFGYQQYQLLGVQQEPLKADKVYRLNLGEGFVVFVTPKGVAQDRHELDLEWTSGKASLMKTTVKIKQNKYLFVKGPGVGNDWIVLAITVCE